MSAKKAMDRTQEALQSDKGWSGGPDALSKHGAAGSAGARVWQSQDGRTSVGAGVSMSKDFHGGNPKFGFGVGASFKF